MNSPVAIVAAFLAVCAGGWLLIVLVARFLLGLVV